jgi:FMN phosphatase YigB (HAD superfamily)
MEREVFLNVNKSIRAVLFDLDDTLLENDMDRFVKEYFELLTPHMAHRVAPDKFVSALLNATFAMVRNINPAVTNREAFIEDFFPRIGWKAEELMPLFDDFYAGPYNRLRLLTRPNPAARSAVQAAFDAGCDAVIATNPIFPETAIRQRMEWAGVAEFPFKLVTSYEMMHSAKPSPRYYTEILEKIGRCPEECIMVGNDWDNDMAPAMKAGLHVFWVNAAIDSADSVDPSRRGSLGEFRDLLLGLHGS